jgi:glyoxylase-like metal-dependent hydrolase (beta-lactamase superfamily II)
MGFVNCYLLHAGEGYILIDTAAPNSREKLVGDLEGLGCKPGNLRLILLTHGDFDHTGNAAYVRSRFASKTAMHRDDAPMAEHGDMTANRRETNFLLRALVPKLIGFGVSHRFTPDALLADGASLSEYGLAATVISTPGHSKGSIGVLSEDGDLYCGDFFVNSKKPSLNSLVDDPEAMARTAGRLRTMGIRMVYPGHGRPFAMEQLAGAS